jgi:hypothetical protein
VPATGELNAMGADSQWALTMTIPRGRGMFCAHERNCIIHSESSKSGGAPWLMKMAGMGAESGMNHRDIVLEPRTALAITIRRGVTNVDNEEARPRAIGQEFGIDGGLVKARHRACG